MSNQRHFPIPAVISTANLGHMVEFWSEQFIDAMNDGSVFTPEGKVSLDGKELLAQAMMLAYLHSHFGVKVTGLLHVFLSMLTENEN